MYTNIYIYLNGTTSTSPIIYDLYGSLYNAVSVSQQVLYSDGTSFTGSVNFTAKDITRSIGEEYRNGLDVSNWILKFRAKFE